MRIVGFLPAFFGHVPSSFGIRSISYPKFAVRTRFFYHKMTLLRVTSLAQRQLLRGNGRLVWSKKAPRSEANVIVGSRGFCNLSRTNLGPYLEEYIINPEWHTAMTPPSWFFWHIAYTGVVSGSYLAFILHYNYYHYGQLVLRTHTGLTLTEDSW